MIAPRMEVMKVMNACALGFSQDSTKSTLICNSFFSNQAALRKGMYRRQYSVTSTIQDIGRPKKYLKKTSTRTPNVIKTIKAAPKRARNSMTRSKPVSIFNISFKSSLHLLIVLSPLEKENKIFFQYFINKRPFYKIGFGNL